MYMVSYCLGGLVGDVSAFESQDHWLEPTEEASNSVTATDCLHTPSPGGMLNTVSHVWDLIHVKQPSGGQS